MPFTDKRQQSSLRFASFHIQKAFIRNKCAFCMSLDEQTLRLSENSSQREEASMLKGSTLKSPKNQEAAETCGSVESPSTPTLRYQDSARSVQGHQHLLVSTTGCITLTAPTRAVAIICRQKAHDYTYIHT